MFQVLERLSSKSYLARSQNEKVIRLTHSLSLTHTLQETISFLEEKKKKQLIHNCKCHSLCVETVRPTADREQEAMVFCFCFSPQSMSEFSLEELTTELER